MIFTSEHETNGDITHLGEFNGYDLYYSCQVGLPTVIARFGDAGHEYKSGMVFADHDTELGEAKKRALALNLKC